MKMTIWIVCLNHKHGSDLHAVTTEAQADKIVGNFAKKWWWRKYDPEKKLIPNNLDAIIQEYFEDQDEESYQIQSAEIDAPFDRIEKLEETFQQVQRWIDAYPLDIFPEPDFEKARELLEAGGMTLDSISASNMRHVLKGISEIIQEWVKNA